LVIEIVAPVIAALRDYIERGGRSGIDAILADPKFEIVLGDGRHLLALEEGGYDVIEADAILPKTALSGMLYSHEFLRQVRARCAPGSGPAASTCNGPRPSARSRLSARYFPTSPWVTRAG
jgi:spermidine synthase